jgi:hypothetical protein
MSRAVNNLLIVLAMAVVATIVLALSANSGGVGDPFGLDDTDDIEADAETVGSVESLADQALTDDAAADTGTIDEDATATGQPERPSYLDPEPTQQTPLDDPPADEPETSVLGTAITQETSSAEELAQTGPVALGQWFVIAAAIIATGALARNAGRDHADGLLTVLP